LEFRKRIISSYNELFTTRDEEEQNNFSDFTERGQFNKTWGWYGSIYALAKGDATKFDEITRLRLTKCLTYLTFEKQKNQIEHNEIRKQYRQ
jgi:phage head maturation protease